MKRETAFCITAVVSQVMKVKVPEGAELASPTVAAAAEPALRRDGAPLVALLPRLPQRGTHDGRAEEKLQAVLDGCYRSLCLCLSFCDDCGSSDLRCVS